jgi:hypothetical protein
VQPGDALREVIGRDKLRVLARDEQHVAKTLRPKMARLRLDLVHRKRDAQDGIVAGKAAILAAIDALVGKIDRREKPHRAPKELPRQGFRISRHRLQFRAAFRLDKGCKALQDTAV